MGNSDSPRAGSGTFTTIPDELYGALLRAKLSSRRQRIVLALLFQSVKWYGRATTEGHASLSRLADMTGIARNHVSTDLGWLESRGVIARAGKTGRTQDWTVRHPSQWDSSVLPAGPYRLKTRSSREAKAPPVAGRHSSAVPENGHSKVPGRGTVGRSRSQDHIEEENKEEGGGEEASACPPSSSDSLASLQPGERAAWVLSRLRKTGRPRREPSEFLAALDRICERAPPEAIERAVELCADRHWGLRGFTYEFGPDGKPKNSPAKQSARTGTFLDREVPKDLYEAAAKQFHDDEG